MFSLNDYNYDLPDEHIAQELANPADSCRLLSYSGKSDEIHDYSFIEISKLIPKKSHIIFNNSKVIKARIAGDFSIENFKEVDSKIGKNSIHGEIFFLRAIDTHTFEALVRPGKKMKPGTTLGMNGYNFIIKEITEAGRIVTCSHPILEVCTKLGTMPLPPYISYKEEKEDSYQPVFAEHLGSVAAPTASLHFTERVLNALKKKDISNSFCTLHVGLGTFKQVDTENITEYSIHSEFIEVEHELFEIIAEKKKLGVDIVGVGSTVTRTIESLPYLRKQLTGKEKENFSNNSIKFWNRICKDISHEQAKKYIKHYTFSGDYISADCTLYIIPGFTFRILSSIITNFHLPKSSLLMLVAAFIGFDTMKKIYKHAIEKKYMFYSFGDTMVLKP